MASPKDPQITALKTIEAALKLIDTKKQNLKKAYDDLQAHTSLHSSSISWSDLDSHFTSLQNQLNHRFHLLKSLDSSSNNPPPSHDRIDSVTTRLDSDVPDQSRTISPPNPSPCSNPTSLERVESVSKLQDPSPSNPTSRDRLESDETDSEAESLSEGAPVQDDLLASSNPGSQKRVQPRVELVSMCERMDGRGLRNYISNRPKERIEIRNELVVAMQVAPDPAAMVLDAMDGFYGSSKKIKASRDCVRKSCLNLLQVLIEIKPELSDEVKEKAKKLALEWKKKVTLKEKCSSDSLGFLTLVAAYRLENEFDMGELLDYFASIAKFRQALSLFLTLGLGEKTADLIQRLIDNGKQLLAVKFMFKFGLSDKFQPVPLLKGHLKKCKKFTEKVCKGTKSSITCQNEARCREVNALRSVIKLIHDHKLKSEFTCGDLEKRLEILEKQKADTKRPTPTTDNRPLQQQNQQANKQQHGNKRPRTIAPGGPVAVPVAISGSSSPIPPFQSSHLHLEGLLPAAGPYGLVGFTPPIAPYAGVSAGPYGLAGAAMGFPGNSYPVGAHSFPSGSSMPSSYYIRPDAHGGYSMPPQYHPAYFRP